MLPRLKIIFAASWLLGLMSLITPVLADNVVVTTCTNAGLQTAINSAAQNGGGTVTFNCGTITIPITTTLQVDSQTGAKNITIDGGSSVTLDGQNTTRILFQRTWGNNANTLNLQNITLTRGRASDSSPNGAKGGAILSRFEAAQPSLIPILNIDNVTFSNNGSVFTTGTPAEYGGGAIFVHGAVLNVTDSTFTGNTAGNGGMGGYGAAIHILQSPVTIANTTFTNNIATNQGGAVYIDGLGGASGVFSITDSSFTGNRSHFSGGAIYVNMYENSTQFTVDRTSFINNGVNGGDRAQGGAIAGGSTTSGANTGNAIISISNSLFSQNFVDLPGTADGSGGAINFNQKARVTIANSTFDSNRAEGNSWGANGGAIFVTSNTDQFVIVNSTISNNFAGWVGGGVVASPLPGTTTPGGIIRNTIFSNNTADNGSNGWNISHHCGSIDLGGNVAIPMLVNGGNNIQFPAKLTNNWNDKDCATGITIANPLLAPLANNGGPTQTRALQSGSPAIDSGSNAVCAAAPINNVDQRGQTRPVDGDGLNGAQCDVGAFEFVSNQPPFAPTLSLPANTAQLIGTFTAFTWQPAPFATSYRLQVDDDANFSSPIVDTTVTGTTFIPTYIGLGTFSWKVESINVNGSEESVVRTFTLSSAASAVPTRNFTEGSSQILTWSRLTWAVGYQVEIATDAGFTDIVVTSVVLPASADSYTASLDPGVYYWRVKGQQADLSFGAGSAAEMLTVGSG